VDVREAKARDLAALADLMAASPLLVRYGVTRAGALKWLEDALGHGDVLLMARGDGDPAPSGLAWLQRLRGFGGAAYLRLLLVAEDHQGRGLGARLLAAAEQRAAVWSRHMLLLTTADNHAARRFYERHGYQCAGQLERLILPDADEFLYHKVLPPA
jgi:GNAT superfamily N-acetyltransferase